MTAENNIFTDKGLEEEIREIRRHLHQYPGLSEHEEESAAYLAEKLEQWGIPYEMVLDGTGIVAVLQGDSEGPVVGLRADIDALPVQEETGLPYASKIPGVMHACGHDAHAAILMGVAKVLSGMRSQLKGTVKFFFQPAEESVGGAARMIEAGCLENPHVDFMLGLHVAPEYETGQVGIRYGKMYAASDMIDITVHGKGAHGAQPEAGVDSIMAAAAILNGIQPVISRNVAPTDSAVCSIGKIHGGTVRNQIADCVEMSGIIRTLDPKTRIEVRNRIQVTAEGIGQVMGAEVYFHVTESYGPLINDDAVTAAVERNAKELLGGENVFREEVPELGCEDFSYFAAARPACYFHLGCSSPEAAPDQRLVLHNSCFQIDEHCMITGVALQVKNVLALLET